jgi:parvulin-like peptidyl-prolyl isomerase
MRELPQPAQQRERFVPAHVEQGQRHVPDVPHQMTKVVWQEHGVIREEERNAPPPGVSVAYTRIQAAILLQVLIGVTLKAQLAPVPSHQPAQSPPTRSAVVARVNGTPIGAEDVDAALNTVIPLNSYHQNVKPDKLDELRAKALDGLIDEELRYQEAVRLKVQVPPIEVEQALDRARKSYADNAAFERARRESGATMPQLRASILRALMIRKVYEQVVESGCRVDDADASAYYRANTARFVVPEQVHVSLITIGVDSAASQETWKQARRTAEDLAKRIAAGAAFDAIAREHASDSAKLKSGDLGFVHRGQLIDEFEKALNTLQPGQVSPVVQTIYGFHLLRLIETRPPAQKSFADVKTTLIRDLTASRCTQASADWSKRLRAAARIEILQAHGGAGKIAG